MIPDGKEDPRSERLDSIDGLRGLAATWVVLFHIWNRFYPGLNTLGGGCHLPEGQSPWFYLTFFLFQYGYVGVNLFFVISGFCIHLPYARRYHREGHDGFSGREFARRRFWRLYPGYFASLIFTSLALGIFPLLFSLTAGRSGNWAEIFQVKDVLINAAFLQPVWPGSLGFNGVYWSLVYEVQFYLCYPILLLGYRKWGGLSVGAILLAAQVAFLFVRAPFACFLFTRYFEWYLGMVAAEWLMSRRPIRCPKCLAPAGIACFALGIGTTLAGAISPLRDLAFSTAFFLGIVALTGAGQGPGGLDSVGRWIRSRAAVLTGQFSYSLYLIHVPVVDVAWILSLYSVEYLGFGAPLARTIFAVSAITLSFVTAYFFHVLFERPFVKRRGLRVAVEGRRDPGTQG